MPNLSMASLIENNNNYTGETKLKLKKTKNSTYTFLNSTNKILWAIDSNKHYKLSASSKTMNNYQNSRTHFEFNTETVFMRFTQT